MTKTKTTTKIKKSLIISRQNIKFYFVLKGMFLHIIMLHKNFISCTHFSVVSLH